ncbi:class I SAM-dependent methyltransferase [Algoriphagus sp.]|uniref:class I SAM-dependent methyltransferase n=1 Tax=Algoriphagus sp. TaxID=1872435 RepID=UPI003F722922
MISKLLKSFYQSQSLVNKRKWSNRLRYFKSIGKTDDINYLAQLYKTDKWGKHFYTPHYYSHFKPFKHKAVNLLEIGVGGYDDPFQGGGSLRMWKRFFSKANIFAIDIYDKSPSQEDRITIFQGSQVDGEFLDLILEKIGELDLIVDDGSHINEHVIYTFEHLFPKLKNGGIYVVEDIQTSYWPEYGGDSYKLNSDHTIMGYFKKKLDGINHEEFLNPGYRKSYFDLNIVSMHFYHNMIFIYKGDNQESSNFVIDNERFA